MSTENQLVVIEDKNALQLFTADKGLDPVLQNVRKIIDEFEPDVSTKKGRDAVASLAYSIAKSKTYLDGIGKQLVDDLKKKPKLVDAERKRVRDTLEAWKDEARKPLTELEDKEKSVIQRLDEMLDCDLLSAVDINQRLDSAKAIDVSFAVIKPKELEKKKAEVIEQLEAKHQRQHQYEEQERELEAMRQKQAEQEARERDERIAREAEERARREHEQKAQREREEAEAKARQQREAEERQRQEEQRKIEAEREEQRQREFRLQREKEEAEQRAIRAAEEERNRIEQQRRQEEEDRQRAAANLEHRKAVNNEILQALTENGLTDEQAKTVVKLAVKGQAGRLTVNY